MSTSSSAPVILVVDDEASIVDAMERVLRKEDFEVLTAPDGRTALERIRQQPVHVVLTDLRMPGMTGEDLLKAVKSLAPEIEVVVMTAYGTIANAVDAMRYGAYDFVSKPLKRADVVSTIRKAVERRNLVVENKSLRAELEAVRRSSMVGNSQVLRSTIEIAEQAAASSASVLLMGESGTGKELLAQMVHERSARADGPFIATNCAALPESILESELFGHEKGAFTGAVKERVGRFEQAHGGTLFLDEIGELPLSVQVKLLRAIQEGEVEPVGGTTRKVDFRLVCATNRNLAEDVKAGKFREDLFYRINVVPLYVPPLRDRAEDVPLLVEHFLRMFRSRHQSDVRDISDAAMAALSSYGWPGNVRELENAIERAVVLCRGTTIELEGLPAELRDTEAGHGRQLVVSVGTPLQEVERRLIMETLKFTRGDKRLAADLLGIATRTIYRKLESGAIQDESYSPQTSRSENGDDSDEGVYH